MLSRLMPFRRPADPTARADEPELRPGASGNGAVPEPALMLAAEASDSLSGRSFRVWRQPSATASRGRLLRVQARPVFVVEADGAPLARLHSWSDVVAWHDRNVIGAGWRVLDEDAVGRSPRG